MRRSLFVAALLTSASAVNAQPGRACRGASGGLRRGPARICLSQDAKRVDVVDNRFRSAGRRPLPVVFEDDVRNDPAVEAWVTAENPVTDRFLKTLPLRGWFKDRMTQLYDYERVRRAGEEGRALFLHAQLGLQNQAVLFVRDGLRGKGASADRSERLVGGRGNGTRRMNSKRRR